MNQKTITAKKLAKLLGVDKIAVFIDGKQVTPIEDNRDIPVEDIPFFAAIMDDIVSDEKRHEMGMVILQHYETKESATTSQKRQELNQKLRDFEGALTRAEGAHERKNSTLKEIKALMDKEQKDSPKYLSLKGDYRRIEKEADEAFRLIKDLEGNIKRYNKAIKELVDEPQIFDGFIDFIKPEKQD